MSYCPKCGREIVDESLGCPICSVKENSRPNLSKEPKEVQKVDSFTVEDEKGGKQESENQQQVGGTWGQSPNPQFAQGDSVEGKVIPVPLKVLIIALLIIVSLFFSGLGAVAGLIAGIILMRSPVLDYQKFGKTLTIISGVLLGLSVICCLVLTGLISLGIITDSVIY